MDIPSPYGSPLFVSSNQTESALSYLKVACSIRCPFVTNDFDYLNLNIGQTTCEVKSLPYSFIITYQVQYFTTLKQTLEASSKVKKFSTMNDDILALKD